MLPVVPRRKDEATSVLAAQIEKVTVTLKVRVGDNGKMFGSVASERGGSIDRTDQAGYRPPEDELAYLLRV